MQKTIEECELCLADNLSHLCDDVDCMCHNDYKFLNKIEGAMDRDSARREEEIQRFENLLS